MVVMMPKFIVQNTIKNGGRRGSMYELFTSCIEHSAFEENEFKIETPACLLYTKNGCVPHLTDDVLQEITKNPLPLIVPVVTVASNENAVKKFGKGLAVFMGLNEHMLYMSVQDPGVGTPRGFNDKLGVSMWSKSGRFQVNTSKYMDIQEAFKPSIYEALYDGDTDVKSTKKRISKSVTRSLQYLDECIARHLKSEVLKNASIFGAVVGGYSLTQRQYSAKQTALRPVDGFVIEGLHNYGPLVENMSFAEVQEMLLETLKLLPENKPRVFHGACNPKLVLEAVGLGIDLFDSSYPYLATERGCALIFSYDYKRPNVQSESFEVDLKNTKFKEDFTPLLEGCQCYSCLQHTKAYVSHLLFTEEMLAHVLLSIHNNHHYLRFFTAIRDSLDENCFHDLKNLVENCKPKI